MEWQEALAALRGAEGEVARIVTVFGPLLTIGADLHGRIAEAVAVLQPLATQAEAIEGAIAQQRKELERLQAAVVTQREQTTRQVQRMQQELAMAREAHGPSLKQLSEAMHEQKRKYTEETAQAKADHEAALAQMEFDRAAYRQALEDRKQVAELELKAVQGQVTEAESRLAELARVVQRGHRG